MRHSTPFRGAAALALMMALALTSSAQDDTVTQWNAIMQTTVGTAPTNANYQARWAAIVQLAVFEAVNAIEQDYEPYLGIIDAPPGASPDAAAIAAAHRTLVTLRPTSAATLDAARALSLAAIPDGEAKDNGILVGEEAAAAVLTLRASDGWDAVVPYTPGNAPGDWQPALPTFAPAFHPHWGQVIPFGLDSGSQIKLPPPPALRSFVYAIGYIEVKLVGSIDSPFRPQDRTDVARFYASSSPVQVWNSAARQVIAAQGTTLAENARILALMGMAICDASIAAYDSKYHHNFWRPLTAIRAGDTDRNLLTRPDVEWLPLLNTPAFPGYPSAHATLSGAARAVLEDAFGEGGHAITLTNSSLPAVVLHYSAFEQITDDIDDARVYGGIHFRFDQEAGADQGRRVGRYILRNYLRSECDDLGGNGDDDGTRNRSSFSRDNESGR